MRFFFCFCPLVFFGAISNELFQGLRALQQIRTLIPERFTKEEFSILVDQKEFQKSLNGLCSHNRREMNIPSVCNLGGENYYLLRWTCSGEPLRILDVYEEFEYGPFWQYPSALDRLNEMESTTQGMQ